MINIAAPWGGAIKALRLMISGDNIDVRLISEKKNSRRENRGIETMNFFSVVAAR
jgi:hypothetical protein